MKTRYFIILIFLLSTHFSNAQDSIQKKQTITNQESRKIAHCVVSDVLQIQCSLSIDRVTISDHSGTVIYTLTPTNNTVSVRDLQSGFYLLEAYVEGTKVKKGIIKKIG